MDLPSPALVRFHLQVGARLALRVLAPVVAFACGAAGFFEKDFLRNLSATLFTGGNSGLLVAAVAGLGLQGEGDSHLFLEEAALLGEGRMLHLPPPEKRLWECAVLVWKCAFPRRK